MAELLKRETKLINITKIVHKSQILGPGRNKTNTLSLHMTAEDVLGKHVNLLKENITQFIRGRYH